MFLGCYLDIQSFTVLYEAQALRGFLSIVVIFLTKLFANGMLADPSLMKVRNLVPDVLVLESSLSFLMVVRKKDVDMLQEISYSTKWCIL